jgi:hypothetical protein
MKLKNQAPNVMETSKKVAPLAAKIAIYEIIKIEFSCSWIKILGFWGFGSNT